MDGNFNGYQNQDNDQNQTDNQQTDNQQTETQQANNQQQYNPNYTQTPPSGYGMRSADYSYSWDGKEYCKKKKKSGGRTFGIICLAVLLTVSLLFTSVLLAVSGDEIRDFIRGYSNDDESNVSGSVSTPKNDTESNPAIADTTSVPEVVRHANSTVEYSSELTEVYGKCSQSCLSVQVTYNKSSGYALGSGFVLTADGYIATNEHVVDDGDKFKVIFYDGTEYEAELIGSDAASDLAVLKIEAENLTPLEIGDSSKLSIGEQVLAIGTPYGMELAGTLTVGVVSGIARDIEMTDDYGRVVKTMTLIQTDANINAGNSGGPLINMAGQVIGLNFLKIVQDSSYNQYEGICFAIPINSAVDIINQIIAGVNVDSGSFVESSARLGITVYNVDAGLSAFRIRTSYDYPQGVLVTEIDATSAAYNAGLQIYDIITSFNGTAITSTTDLTTELAKFKAGEHAKIEVFRFNRSFTNGETFTIEFNLDSAA